MLRPVERELKAKGHRFFFLGRPALINNKDGSKSVKYWLNGQSSPEAGYHSQPVGWYTPEELRAEDFVPKR
jgi:hypothetical protein